MYRKCRHIQPTGHRCQSPAIKGANFCYFHNKFHTLGAEPFAKYGPIVLPSPENPASILLSIAKIDAALLSGRLEPKHAALLLYSMQIASQHLASYKPGDSEKMLQTFHANYDGDELAPEEFAGEIDEHCGDCTNCPRNEQSPNCPCTDNPIGLVTSDPVQLKDSGKFQLGKAGAIVIQTLTRPSRKIEPSPCPRSSNICPPAKKSVSHSPAGLTPLPPSTG